MKTFFTDKKAKKAIENLYLQKLDELEIGYEFMNVETTFGNTNIVITGLKESRPLVLLHGFNSCAPMALEAMIDLNEHFRIYAIDLPGQPNLSDDFRLNKNDDSYGKWLYEILSRLSISNAFLVGISIGGFVALKSLIFDERRIAKAFLIVPAGIVNGNPLKTYWKVQRPIKQYKKHQNEKSIERLVNNVFSENDEFAEAFLSRVILHYKLDFSPIPLIGKNEGQKIKTPISIFAAKNDVLFPGQKLIKRALDIFPLLSEVVLLGNSKHVPSTQDNRKIAEIISNSIRL